MAHTVKNAGMKFESHKYIEFLPSFGHPASLKADKVNLQISKHSNVKTFFCRYVYIMVLANRHLQDWYLKKVTPAYAMV